MRRVSEKELWSAAEDREFNALEALNFADVVDIPQDRNTLPVMWVYKYKTNELGLRILYKARLVARGDKAIEDFNYFDTFAPVAKIESIRLVLDLIIIHQVLLLQLDIDNAFVQSDLVEDMYINAVPGRPLPSGKCYKLNCALYGLKQAGRNWNSKCSSYFIDELGFIQLRNDLCVYILVVNEKLVAVIALYMDDIILGFDTEDRKHWFSTNICSKFSTKVIGLPNVIGLSLT
jgi:hypothetical protein